MATRLRKSYRFAIRSSLLISLVLTLIIGGLQLLFTDVHWVALPIFALLTFIVSLVILQLRIERFIYKRIKKIYDDVALLES
ncbi:MAG: sensor histidine kinase, partial [Flavobacteriaceae bacterium]